MPMPDNGFIWRPNDNSAKTNLRYTLEAEKWVNAVSSAQRRTGSRSISQDISMIGMIIELIFSVILLLLLFLLNGIKAIVKLVETKVETNRSSQNKNEANSGGKTEYVWNFEKKEHTPNRVLFDSNGEPWFIWTFLLRFVFIFGCIYTVLGLVRPYVDPNYDMGDQVFLLMAGGFSACLAFMGAD